MTISTTTFAIAISLIASVPLTAAHARASAQQPQQLERSSLDRADVKNDLADWNKAGFDPHSYHVLSYDVFGAEYQRRYAKYLELKRLRAQAAARE